MTGQRILTAAVAIPVVVFAVLYFPALVFALFVVVMLLGLREFFALAEAAGAPGHSRWTYLCAVTLIAAPLRGLIAWEFAGRITGKVFVSPETLPQVLTELVLIVFVLGSALLILAEGRTPEQSVRAMGTTAAGFLFVAVPLSFLLRIFTISRDGPLLLLFLLVLIWVGDTAAYFAGRQFGKHVMAPVLSPKKTWEGAVANMAGSLVVALVFKRWLYVELSHLLAMAALANLAGQMGDLAESAYKRAASAKESGGLLPGHGGILDRIDSLIFAAPVVWYYFSVVIGRHF